MVLNAVIVFPADRKGRTAALSVVLCPRLSDTFDRKNKEDIS